MFYVGLLEEVFVDDVRESLSHVFLSEEGAGVINWYQRNSLFFVEFLPSEFSSFLLRKKWILEVVRGPLCAVQGILSEFGLSR